MPAWVVRLLPYLLAPLLLWGAYHWAYSRGERAADARHAETFARLAELTRIAADKARAATAAVAIERADLDEAHQRELSDAKLEADRLRDDLRAGRRELQEWWACPVSGAEAGDSASDGFEADAARRADSAAAIAQAVAIDAAVIDHLWSSWQADRRAVIAAGCAVEAPL